MAVYSLVFFGIALWLSLTPGKLVNRIGHYLTPTLLMLLLFLFVSFLFRGETNVAGAQDTYATTPFLKGFAEGYNTKDTIAALNFGLVIATTLSSFGLQEKKDVMHHTVLAGMCAGVILALVYGMLSYMGMCSSGVYTLPDNGAQTLRSIVYQLFGAPGAVLLATIFTLACLTTCVGLINSISQYFSTLFSRLTYRQWVFIITVFSFLVCNLGLNTILSISVPVLNAIYPVSIVLILLGLTHGLWKNNRYIYPCVVSGTAIISVIYVMDETGLPELLTRILPLYSAGYGWIGAAAVMLAFSMVLQWMNTRKRKAKKSLKRCMARLDKIDYVFYNVFDTFQSRNPFMSRCWPLIRYEMYYLHRIKLRGVLCRFVFLIMPSRLARLPRPSSPPSSSANPTVFLALLLVPARFPVTSS